MGFNKGKMPAADRRARARVPSLLGRLGILWKPAIGSGRSGEWLGTGGGSRPSSQAVNTSAIIADAVIFARSASCRSTPLSRGSTCTGRSTAASVIIELPLVEESIHNRLAVLGVSAGDLHHRRSDITSAKLSSDLARVRCDAALVDRDGAQAMVHKLPDRLGSVDLVNVAEAVDRHQLLDGETQANLGALASCRPASSFLCFIY